MKKEWKDYQHLYLGCQVMVKRKNDTEYHTGRSCEITRESNHGDWVVVWFDEVIAVTSQTWNISYSNSHWFFLSEDFVKPILRPLSDITEQEEDEYTSIIDKWNFGFRRNMLGAAASTRYLLSRHFDLFGLIESGLAISKPTLQK